MPVAPVRPEGSSGGFGEWTRGNGDGMRLYVLTSGPTAPNPGEIVSSKRFGELLETLAPQADIVLVDSPALLAVGDTPALGDKVDGLLFLVEPDVVRKQQVMKITRIRHRRDPIWHVLLPGALEHKILMGMPREPTILRRGAT